MIDPELELVIFDADGTLRWVTVPGQHYPLKPDQWRLMPRVQDVVSELARRPLKFAMASNQHGVALGLLDRALAEAMLRATWEAACGPAAPPVHIEMCVCLPDAQCPRKKPEPGMLLAILKAFSVDPQRALYVGDLAVDELAARRAKVHFQWAGEFFR